MDTQNLWEWGERDPPSLHDDETKIAKQHTSSFYYYDNYASTTEANWQTNLLSGHEKSIYECVPLPPQIECLGYADEIILHPLLEQLPTCAPALQWDMTNAPSTGPSLGGGNEQLPSPLVDTSSCTAHVLRDRTTSDSDGFTETGQTLSLRTIEMPISHTLLPGYEE